MSQRLFNRRSSVVCWLCLLGLFFACAAAALAAETSPRISVEGDGFLMNGRPFKPWGIRVASAAIDPESTRELISHLDEYQRHGVNSLTVFYQGSSGGYTNPFSADGRLIDAGVQQRMEEIIRAAAQRRMLVVVGIFYQRASFPFRNPEAVRKVVEEVTASLRPHGNVIINIANEQNSQLYKPTAEIFDLRDPQHILDLCRVVKRTDPRRLVGAGGYDHARNEVLGRAPELDVLLFDTSGLEPNSGALYRRFLAAGVTNKPMVNVETFGGWTRKFLPQGVFPEEVKQAYGREVKAAAETRGLSVFFHNNPWCQGPSDGLPRRYDLGGHGTESNPGIRWYFEMVREAARRSRAELDKREARKVAGWNVHISSRLLASDSAATEKALELLREQLEEIQQVVPAKALAELQKFALWMSPVYPGTGPKAEYHPSARWLIGHGRDPAMEKGVEFTNVRIFEAERRRMPNFALHELAHAYHDVVLSWENPELKLAYERARASGKYDNLEHRDGNGKSSRGRAYAMTNVMEYFAETTEAFFSTNDIFPFTRAELKAHDPEMYRLLVKVWGGEPLNQSRANL